ncbi:MAG: NUDIX domain-containing protein [bacterium]|nr:NUDIX domain-containing protein [bacterium]
MTLAVTRFGNELVDFYPMPEPVVPTEDAHIPLTFTLVTVEYDGKILLLYDPDRKQWETPGGGLEPGESCHDCAAREVFEETGQVVENLTFRGLFKLWFKEDGRYEYGALYGGTLSEIRPFTPNSESERILLWDGQAALDGDFSELSRALLAFR